MDASTITKPVSIESTGEDSARTSSDQAAPGDTATGTTRETQKSSAFGHPSLRDYKLGSTSNNAELQELAEQRAAAYKLSMRTDALSDIIDDKCLENWGEGVPAGFDTKDKWATEIAGMLKKLISEQYTLKMAPRWGPELYTWGIVTSSPDENTREFIRANGYQSIKSAFMNSDGVK